MLAIRIAYPALTRGDCLGGGNGCCDGGGGGGAAAADDDDDGNVEIDMVELLLLLSSLLFLSLVGWIIDTSNER